ncbi:MAG: Gfo/Idh/MocA family oxidoreductase [Acidobacteria bacterium]|nr:Gfo/Idh/MocA family oxidoreductase [Acidobacteriota bacterium]
MNGSFAPHSSGKHERRDFLGSSATAAGLLILAPKTVFGSQANSAVEVGIIGCGGRGNLIGGFLTQHTTARIVAIADVFQDKLDATQQKLGLNAPRTYKGLRGYQQMVGSKLDAVVIESSDYFHPEQAAAAVSAGKHVFIAKPLAPDVAGCLDVLETGRRAKGKLSFLVDFQSRARPVFQDAAARVHRGELGRPVVCQIYYPAVDLMSYSWERKPGMSEGEYRLRNWYFERRLCGDFIVNQSIHVVDMANWYLQAHPVKAFGSGGRIVRNKIGDVWDHFLVDFWYPNEVKANFMATQLVRVRGFGDMCVRVYGSESTLDSHYNGLVKILGPNPWNGTEKDDTFTGGAITNVKDFIESIQTGRYLNNVEPAVESNLSVILGRTAAYRGGVVTWDEMIREKEKFVMDLNL